MTQALLFLVAFVAGLIDSIAGGGGLITLPALLSAGLAPQMALGTNKLQGSFGSGSAMLHFVAAGQVRLRECIAGISGPLSAPFSGHGLSTCSTLACSAI